MMMMHGLIMLCEVIRPHIFPRPPVKLKLFLRFTVSQPVQPHVNHFHFSGFYFVWHYPLCHIIIHSDWHCGLPVAHLFVFWIDITAFAFRNRASDSASTAKEITVLMTIEIFNTIPLFGGKFTPSYIKWCPLLYFVHLVCSDRLHCCV